TRTAGPAQGTGPAWPTRTPWSGPCGMHGPQWPGRRTLAAPAVRPRSYPEPSSSPRAVQRLCKSSRSSTGLQHAGNSTAMQRSTRTLASVDLDWYCQLVTVTDPSAADKPRLPERRVTISQLVAYNLGFFRRAAGIDQRKMGELLGWSAASVSAAERSWESKRT